MDGKLKETLEEINKAFQELTTERQIFDAYRKKELLRIQMMEVNKQDGKGSPQDDRKVMLDVGGHRFTTTLATLTADPNSMLHAMFSGQFAIEYEHDHSVFLDRDGSQFNHILNWLRNGRVPSGLSSAEIDSLVIEAEYYQLRGMVLALDEKKKASNLSESLLTAETKVVTIVNGWSSLLGINIDKAQIRIQHTITEQEKEGWLFINSSVECCKSRKESGGIYTNVNLVHLFFKKSPTIESVLLDAEVARKAKPNMNATDHSWTDA